MTLKLPVDHSIKTALKTYAKRLLIFLAVVVVELVLILIVLVLNK